MKLSTITKTVAGLFANTDKLYSIMDSGVISVSRFAGGIALTKLSGPEALAQYILLTAIMTFAQSIPSALRLTPMINLATGKTSSERERIFAWSRRQVRISLISGAFIATLCYPLAANYGFGPALYLGFVGATLAGLELQYHRAYSQSRFKMKRVFAAELAGVAFLAAVTGTVWAIFNAPIIGFWWGIALSSLLSILIIDRGNRLQLVDYQNTCDLKELDQSIDQARSNGKAILAGSLGNSACSKVTPFVLENIGGLLAVASFGAVWTLLGPLRMISGAISGALRPRLALYCNSGDLDSFNRTLRLAILGVTVAGAAGAITTAFLGPFLIETLFDSSLRNAGLFLPLAIVYATLDVITTTQMIALQTRLIDGAKVAAKIRIFSAIFSLVLIYPSVLWLGVMGAFLTLLASEFLYLAEAYRVLSSNSGGEFKQQFRQLTSNATFRGNCENNA